MHHRDWASIKAGIITVIIIIIIKKKVLYKEKKRNTQEARKSFVGKKRIEGKL